MQQTVASSLADATDTSVDQHSMHNKSMQAALRKQDLQDTAHMYVAFHTQLAKKHSKQQVQLDNQTALHQINWVGRLLQIVLLTMRLMALLHPPESRCMLCGNFAMGLASIAAENMQEVQSHSCKPIGTEASAQIAQAQTSAGNISALLLTAWMQRLRQCLKSQMLISSGQLFPWLQTIMTHRVPASQTTADKSIKQGKLLLPYSILLMMHLRTTASDGQQAILMHVGQLGPYRQCTTKSDTWCPCAQVVLRCW